MFTSSFPAAACRRTAGAGSPASPASSCPCAFCRVSSAACFSKGSRPCIGRPPRLLRRSRPARRPARLRRRPRAARRTEWVVYAKRPFAGPQAVLAYLARYTHRVAISNSRLIALDATGVTFKWKDYRIEGRDRLKTMTLDARRVHPPLPPPRAAERLPPHPPLRPVRRRGAGGQHRARPTTARRGRECAPAFARGRQSGGRRLACAALPLLRRPDDHRRDVRRAASLAFAVAEPDQDRQLMTVAPHPAAHRRSPPPPAARRNTSATPARGRKSLLRPRPTPRSRASSPSKKLAVFVPDDNTGRRRSPPPHQRSLRDPKIPIGPAQPTAPLPPRGFLLTRLSAAGPAPSYSAPAKGPASETLQ